MPRVSFARPYRSSTRALDAVPRREAGDIGESGALPEDRDGSGATVLSRRDVDSPGQGAAKTREPGETGRRADEEPPGEGASERRGMPVRTTWCRYWLWPARWVPVKVQAERRRLVLQRVARRAREHDRPRRWSVAPAVSVRFVSATLAADEALEASTEDVEPPHVYV